MGTIMNEVACSFFSSMKERKLQKWLLKNTESLEGKRVAITGSTGGIGKELTSYLVKLGASLVLIDRNEKRSLENKKRLLEINENADVTTVTLDLEDASSADLVIRKLEDIGIDVFIHNAGAYKIPRHKCESGFDNVFQINFVTPYYMIKKLLPSLKKRKGRVVVVSSIAHGYSKIDPRDVDFSTRRASSKVYGNAKRFLTYSLFELFREEKDVALAVAHPGITFTNITNHYPKIIFAIIKEPMKIIFMKPKKATLSILSALFEKTEYLEWIGPSIFETWGYPKKKTLKTAKREEREEIFRISEKIFFKLEENGHNNQTKKGNK